ncbi:hypothetical protein VaNZ11_001253 [Volvox africanus]|uniref:Uncharacterized protein n=1 Tax=Volvox africanus TaxID=51714 RepID=A0ABQ5RPB6_9CHLO|nr:hypothetical protein VaNZ11_001253 [Volvox africanus]
MDGSGYGGGYGQPGWPYPAPAMVVSVLGYPAAMQPYGMAYGSLAVAVSRGSAHYDRVPPCTAVGFRYGMGAVPRAAEGPEAYDELWYQGFYRGYDGEHGGEHVEQTEALYGEPSNAEAVYEEPDCEGDDYGEMEYEDDAEDELNGDEPADGVYDKISNSEGVKMLTIPLVTAEVAVAGGAIRKTGIHRLNPAAPTFLNPSAKTFVPSTKAAEVVPDGSKPPTAAAEAAPSVAASAGPGSSTPQSEKLGRTEHRDNEASGQVSAVQMADEEVGTHASSSQGINVHADKGAGNADSDGMVVQGRCADSADGLSVNQATHPVLPAARGSSAAAEEEIQSQQRQCAEASSLHKPLAVVKPGRACLAIPTSPLSPSICSDSVQGVSEAGDGAAKLSDEILSQSAAQKSAVAEMEEQRPGEEHVASLQVAAGLAAGGPAKTTVTQGGGDDVTAQGEAAESRALTMSDMKPVSTPFQRFITGLFSLFQGPRGEYGAESLWWVLDSHQKNCESAPLEGQVTGCKQQANTSAASPSAQQQQQQQGQQHAIIGPYSSEQMILAYIAQALSHELLVCGTRGCSPPTLMPSADCFRPLGLLLEAAEAGKPYDLLPLQC